MPVTKVDYDKLRNWRGEKSFKEKINQNIKRIKSDETSTYAEVRRDEQGMCNFLDEEGLCTLQKTCGAQMLPITCQTFPRAMYFVRSIKFGIRSLYAVCEVVVQKLLDMEEGIGFIMEEREATIHEESNAIGGDRSIPYQNFLPIKSALIDILQNRAYTMNARMILFGIALRSYLEKAENWTEESMAAWLRQCAIMADGNDYQDAIDAMETEKGFFNSSCISVISVVPKVNEYIRDLYRVELGEDGEVAYADLQKALELEKSFDETCTQSEHFLENLMVNYILSKDLPFHSEGVWGGYCHIACVYRMFRFLLASYYNPEDQLKNVVDPVVQMSRQLLYNRNFADSMHSLLKKQEQNTLAHLAMMLKS